MCMHGTKQINKPAQQLYHVDQYRGNESSSCFFAVEEVSWIASDISTAANHSRDHRATRRISSTVTLQSSARTQPITLDSLLVLWQDNIHPNLFMFCSYQWSVCLFVPCVWDSLWCVWLDTNSVHGNWGFGFCNWGLGFWARFHLCLLCQAQRATKISIFLAS